MLPFEAGRRQAHIYALALPVTVCAGVDAHRRHRDSIRARPTTTVSLRAVRVLGSPRVGPRTRRLPGRLERRPAVLRDTQQVPTSSRPPRDRTSSPHHHACRPGTSRLLELPLQGLLFSRTAPRRLHQACPGTWPYMTSVSWKSWNRAHALAVVRCRRGDERLARRLAADRVPLLTRCSTSQAIVGAVQHPVPAQLEAFLIELFDQFLAFATSSGPRSVSSPSRSRADLARRRARCDCHATCTCPRTRPPMPLPFDLDAGPRDVEQHQPASIVHAHPPRLDLPDRRPARARYVRGVRPARTPLARLEDRTGRARAIARIAGPLSRRRSGNPPSILRFWMLVSST